MKTRTEIATMCGKSWLGLFALAMLLFAVRILSLIHICLVMNLGVPTPQSLDDALKTEADSSTHHPQAEKRLGPRSLRMTASVW